MSSHVLVLGGTAEARELAFRLVEAGVQVTSSLAGRVSNPRLPAGQVRVGGFGGAEGLASYLREHRVTSLVDATHPFAARMSRHAGWAAERARVPVLRLARPGWAHHPAAGSWTWVNSHDEAAEVAAGSEHPFLTTGRQSLQRYAEHPVLRTGPVLVRVVEPPVHPVPGQWSLVRDRGPYVVGEEVALLRAHGIDVLVTKDSGGSHTSAKLDAAATVGAVVVVVRRPAPQPGVPSVADVGQVLERIRS